MVSPATHLPIVLVVGPTASGKTALGIALARALDAEVVNVDSVQLYRRLDIGSAKPSREERAAVRHHLVDVVDPDARYDAATYASDADRAIADCAARGRRAIVVGGTGLYARALVRGLAKDLASDPATRAALNERAGRGLDELARMHEELSKVDPVYAAKIAKSDPIRIVRALEVFALTGTPMSEHHAKHAAEPPRYRARWLGIDSTRQALAPKIAARAEAMLAAGWVDEVRGIIADYGEGIRSLDSVGYADVRRFVLEGRSEAADRDALLEQIVRSTLGLVKRQRTWFRGEDGVEWASREAHESPATIEGLRAFFEGAEASR
ncbi:MAG: tRNA (adenosine(37)-N6)-dimethylallyltransferase MiaA [Myxococcales bacterium]|nr:tRNA (adenosine(37)-N6)-dimethylallyltransferase MiaA [Myxococcales bacterium]